MFPVRVENFAERLTKRISQNMTRAGKAVGCQWLLIYRSLNSRTVPLGENSCERNYFIYGKHARCLKQSIQKLINHNSKIVSVSQ